MASRTINPSRFLTLLAALVLGLFMVLTGCSSDSPTAPGVSGPTGSMTRASQRDTDLDGIPDTTDDDDDNDGMDDDMDDDDDNDGINDDDEEDSDDDGTIDDHDDDFVEIKGHVSEVGSSSFVVFGYTILVNDDTRFYGDNDRMASFADVTVGAEVEVHGVMASDNTVTAVEVELEDDGDDDGDEDGDDDGDDGNTVSLNGFSVGDWVEAKGIATMGGYRLIDLHLQPAEHRFEYEGELEIVSATSVRLGGKNFVVTENTEFRDDFLGLSLLTDVPVGTRVDIAVDPASDISEPFATRIRTEDNNESFLKVEARVTEVSAAEGRIVVGGVTFVQ